MLEFLLAVGVAVAFIVLWTWLLTDDDKPNPRQGAC